MEHFTASPSIELATSTARGNQFISQPNAICKYYYEGMSIYQTDDGSFYFHPHPQAEMEFYAHGQVELVAALELLTGSYYLEPLEILESSNVIAQAAGFDLVAILVPEAAPCFIVYLADAQAFFMLEEPGFRLLSADLVGQLLTLDPSPNRLSNPHKVTIDNQGQVVRLEEAII